MCRIDSPVLPQNARLSDIWIWRGLHRLAKENSEFSVQLG
jgi:hypothetical protein